MAPPDWKQYSPDSTPDGEPALPTHGTPGAKRPAQPRGKPRRPRGGGPRQRRFHPVGLLIAGGGVLVAVTVPVVIAVVSSGGLPGAEEPQTDEGFTSMLDALREETGDTTVFEAVLYPDYAILDVPYKPGDEREISYRWDGGGLDEWTKGTSDDVPFDLAEVDASRLDGMCDDALALVEDPNVCYLIVRHPRAESDGGWIWAYTSNDFSQGGYIKYALDGTEVARTTW